MPLVLLPQELITPNLQSYPSAECSLMAWQRPDQQDEPPAWLGHSVSMSVCLNRDTKHRKSRVWISGSFPFNDLKSSEGGHEFATPTPSHTHILACSNPPYILVASSSGPSRFTNVFRFLANDPFLASREL